MTEPRETFRSHVARALPRARLTRDTDGWPIVPGRYGRLEWRGLEADGTARVYAYTDRPKMIAKLLALPGVHRHQVGDREAAAWIRAEDTRAIQTAGDLLRLRYRTARVWTPEERAAVADRFRTGLQMHETAVETARAVQSGRSTGERA